MKRVFPLLVLMSIPLFGLSATAENASLEFPKCGTLQRVGEMDNGLFHGSKPKSDEDFACLKALNIRTVVSLEDRVMQGKVEGQLAQKYGMKLIVVPMQPSPIPPMEKTVNNAMSVMRNTNLYPLYFHCHYGRDRTMLMMGLYENQFQNKSASQAWDDMLSYGFLVSPKLFGLKQYYWDHVIMPK